MLPPPPPPPLFPFAILKNLRAPIFTGAEMKHFTSFKLKRLWTAKTIVLEAQRARPLFLDPLLHLPLARGRKEKRILLSKLRFGVLLLTPHVSRF